jgi:hypothetical protein
VRVRFQFEAKRKQNSFRFEVAKRKQNSSRVEAKQKGLFCFKRNSRFYMRNEKKMKRNEAKRKSERNEKSEAKETSEKVFGKIF